jgi:hypothetical protein
MQLAEAVARMAPNLPDRPTLVRVEETQSKFLVQHRSLQPLRDIPVLQLHLPEPHLPLQVVAVVVFVPILKLMLHSVALQAAAEVEAAVLITLKTLASMQVSPAQMVSVAVAAVAAHVMVAEQMESMDVQQVVAVAMALSTSNTSQQFQLHQIQQTPLVLLAQQQLSLLRA